MNKLHVISIAALLGVAAVARHGRGDPDVGARRRDRHARLPRDRAPATQQLDRARGDAARARCAQKPPALPRRRRDARPAPPSRRAAAARHLPPSAADRRRHAHRTTATTSYEHADGRRRRR